MIICDKCGQEINPPHLQTPGRRVCAECGNRIRLRDKWYIGVDGRLRHKSCKNPRGRIETNKEEGLF